MLRRHFITGEDKPDIIITYHSSKHIPFFGRKETRNLLMVANYENVNPDQNIENIEDFNSPISINIVLDTWNDGVGQWGIKFNDSKVFNCYSIILILNNEYVSGSAEYYYDFENNEYINNIGYIESIIFDENITHINGSIITPGNNNKSILKEVHLPNSLKYLTNQTFVGHKNLKSLIVPENVIIIDELVRIYKFGSLDNDALEEITLLPFNPPLSNNNDYGPLGPSSSGELINPNFKIKVYADCIDKYKNDSIWSQYSELYDTINNAIIYKTIDNKIINISNNTNILSNVEIGEPNRFVLTFKDNSTSKDTFYMKLTLQEVILPNLITIAKQTFYSCKNLKKINIPDSVQTIEDHAFDYCIFAKNNIIGDYNKISQSNSYVYIYDFETEDGYIISKHSEGDILEQIRPYIKNVIISDDIKYIGFDNFVTFYNNHTIESIYVGKNVKGNRKIHTVGNVQDDKLDLSLGYSDNIKSLKVDPLNPYYDSRNDCNAIIETATNTLLVGCPTTIIPNTVEIIEYNNAFSRINIETLNIPLSVKKIKDMYRSDTFNYTIINTIIYEGTIEEWNAIEKTGNVYEKAAITIKCSDGEIKYFTRTDT